MPPSLADKTSLQIDLAGSTEAGAYFCIWNLKSDASETATIWPHPCGHVGVVAPSVTPLASRRIRLPRLCSGVSFCVRSYRLQVELNTSCPSSSPRWEVLVYKSFGKFLLGLLALFLRTNSPYQLSTVPIHLAMHRAEAKKTSASGRTS
ncbi:hypothetical protein VTK73DRAFT_1940 [Phialemonium thermophilum]|uniref:Uncharacterized protein n=1 Tax=Phialemonium thermophilum TaxID=223376 RepID=A0ABR3VSU9_9PEZI